MSTTVAPDTIADAEDWDLSDPTVNHYMRRSDIIAGIVDGKPRRAIYGTSFVPESQGGGETVRRRSPICDECARRYSAMGTKASRG